jgi:DNA invertase Pin-like site-specific DNA recombinase
MIYGYARVSTLGQDLSLQEAALTAAGATQIFAEKISGATAREARPKLKKLVTRLIPGDVVLVTRLDRLARSTLDLLHTIDAITKAGASFRSLADTWADTTTPHGKLMLTILGGLAEFERSLILERTEAGIQRARDLGVTFGRPVRLNDKQKLIIAERYAKGETIATLAKEFGVGVGTIHRAMHPAAA